MCADALAHLWRPLDEDGTRSRWERRRSIGQLRGDVANRRRIRDQILSGLTMIPVAKRVALFLLGRPAGLQALGGGGEEGMASFPRVVSRFSRMLWIAVAVVYTRDRVTDYLRHRLAS